MNNFSELMKSNWLVLSVLIYIINIALILYFNPFNVVGDYTQSLIFGIVVVGFVNLLLWIFFDKSKSIPGVPDISKITNTNIFKVISALFLLFFILGLIFATGYYLFFTPWVLTIFITMLNALIVIGLLAVGYQFLSKRYINRLPNSKIGLVLQLIKNLIFLIPCLFIDLVNFVKHQYKITTKTVWLLLLIEITIIILRFSIPEIYNLFSDHDGKIVEKGPIYLNNVKDLGIFQNIKVKNTSKNSDIISPVKYNFALSCWIWINPQPESTSPAYNRSTSLLNYGDIFLINFNRNKIEILAATTENTVLVEPNQLTTIYESTDVPYQRWNNYVINYLGGTLDIFINDVLVVSQINITPILYPNKVTAGAINGINGGIKNVTYYDKPLSRNQIHSLYG